MTTERMLMIAAAAMACVTCCAKADFKDPQKFAEKYVREDVERKYPGEVFNPILQYKGFELVNIHSEMRETLSGANSRVGGDTGQDRRAESQDRGADKICREPGTDGCICQIEATVERDTGFS